MQSKPNFPFLPAHRGFLHRGLGLTLAAATVSLAGCYVAPYYPYYGYPVTTTVASPPSFDRAWDAALGAAADTGIQVTSADRANGHITGTQAGAAVTIDLRRQADNSLQVVFRASDAQDPALHSRWGAAYRERMGR